MKELVPFDCLIFNDFFHPQPELSKQWMEFPENQVPFPDAHIFSVCFFFLFKHFNAKSLHILVKWQHQNEQNGHPRTFYIELRMKPMEVGLNLAL